MKTEQILSALCQEMKDFKNESFARLDRIEQQTIKTNGRVNSHDTEIIVIKKETENCAARKYFENESKATTTGRIALYLTIGMNIILLGLNLYKMKGG